ncbi:hypothetical protein lerEdw1_003895 [Lerista edwardsae]|nr:hypothetical protein lerEdw1_003895 [Lerista edwardsae]
MSACRDVGGFHAWDYVVFAAMLLISAAIGIYYAFAGGGQKTSKDFLMGGRSMTALPVALSLTASFMSAVTVLGTPAEVYQFGVRFTLFAITYTLVIVLSAEVFLPVFYRLGITSTYEYLELRFNKYLRLCGTVLFIILTILYTGIVIYAPALALNQVTGFDLWGAVVATGVVCTFYCTLGGLKAVVWTDVFQVGIMIAGFSSVIIRAVVVQGDIGRILNDSYHGGRLNFWDTVSSSINALAAVTVEDLIKPYFKSLTERKLSWISMGMSLFYGGVCIAMAALASLLGGLLQAALSIFGMVGGPLLGLFSLGILFPFANPVGAFVGLIGGFTASLWVGIGAQIYHPLPSSTMPLSLTTVGCNTTHPVANWTAATELPALTATFETQAAERPILADYWYSLSYLYFSTLGTLVTVSVGIIASLLTGGLRQNVDRKFLLTKEDFLSNFSFLKPKKDEKVRVLTWKPFNITDEGIDNPAFNNIEMNFTDSKEKVNGIHL